MKVKILIKISILVYVFPLVRLDYIRFRQRVTGEILFYVGRFSLMHFFCLKNKRLLIFYRITNFSEKHKLDLLHFQLKDLVFAFDSQEILGFLFSLFSFHKILKRAVLLLYLILSYVGGRIAISNGFS